MLLLHCFNFILFGHTGHVNFDFNWCSVFTDSYFQLWERMELSKSLILRFWDSLHSLKYQPPPPLVTIPILPTALGEIFLPPPVTTIWKTLHQWNKFLSIPKSRTFKNISCFFPQNKNFPWLYHFFIFKKPKICIKFHKNSISCFLFFRKSGFD